MKQVNLSQKLLNVKFISAVFMSIFAASAVVVYGYQFPKHLHITNTLIISISSCICAGVAMLANIGLGTYSLLSMSNDKNEKISFMIIIMSLLGSLPYGFLCYASFVKILPNPLNLALSIIVVLVNAGISYTALNTVVKNAIALSHDKKHFHLVTQEKLSRLAGITIGILVSITMFLATLHGIKSLFFDWQNPSLANGNLPYVIAFISWIPVTALYANGNQEVFSKIYMAIKNYQKTFRSLNLLNIFTIAFCIISGTAFYSQMHDSFDTSKFIPDFFKTSSINYFVYTYLLGIGLLSSSAVNYLSISKLRRYFED